MEEFAHYDLFYHNSQRKAAEGHKASFCLVDSMCVDGVRRRYNCYFGNQGISAKCGDLYANYIECQWIDITGIRLGKYKLQVSLNPHGGGLECDYRNNQASCNIEIDEIYDRQARKWRKVVEVQKCWLSGERLKKSFFLPSPSSLLVQMYFLCVNPM